ncbi:hypothetical protein BJF79_16245 [Actinomadura sp. CNU-125]|uniref:DUF4333 domain-containing protein n=1 Tax=Actinomadura sp. CNU-125 TaxID=1904961 RepID=UPI0009594F70|nr:DUF4333 domain-containing protein [Actinomadura sp. CNU-125]OLT20292.1 hypothetical protein BJF79_16245 [Actinomadura sp. CNU-125]
MQQSTRRRVVAKAAGGALAVLFAAGCSFSVGTKTVGKDDVAQQAKAALGKQVGQEPDDVTCEADLKAEVGETVRCELTVNGEKRGMTATATSVDGGTVKMNFKVDAAPGAGAPTTPAPGTSAPGAQSPAAGGNVPSVSRTEVARQGKAALTAQVGRAPDAFSCPQDLPARVNATVRCKLTADGKQYGVTVTATSVVGGDVKMNFKVDNVPSG